MFRALRRTPAIPGLSLLTLLCVVWVSVSALLHSDDDVLCRVVVEQHDHSAHRVGADHARSPEAPDHCFICHNQSLRSVVATASVSAPAAAQARLVAPGGTGGADHVPQRQPARAPPLA